MVAEVRHVRNILDQHVHKTVSGSKDDADVTVSLDRASISVGDAQVKVAFSVVDHAIC